MCHTDLAADLEETLKALGIAAMNRVGILVAVSVVLYGWGLVHADCPNTCSGHGTCTTKGNGYFCSCYKGFTGGDCSRRTAYCGCSAVARKHLSYRVLCCCVGCGLGTCPTGPAWNDLAIATDRAHQPVVCSNRGTCDYTSGVCTCDAGFQGLRAIEVRVG